MENQKAQIALEFFEEILGTPPIRVNAIDFQAIGLPSMELPNLTNRFMVEEV
jgi:hypothetical protein